MFHRNTLVPELMVTDLQKSLAFWVSCLGFKVAYQRPEDGFAYLDLEGAQVMLEQIDPSAGQWLAAPLLTPFGRGINLQVDVPSVAPIIHRLGLAGFETARIPGTGLTPWKQASASSSFRTPTATSSGWWSGWGSGPAVELPASPVRHHRFAASPHISIQTQRIQTGPFDEFFTFATAIIAPFSMAATAASFRLSMSEAYMKFPMRYLAIGAISVIVLSGCDAAENAANKAVEDAKESAAQIAKDTFSDSAKQLSEQIDSAQESTQSWLNGEKAEDEKAEDSEADAQDRNEA